jgi:hypothetical protein
MRRFIIPLIVIPVVAVAVAALMIVRRFVFPDAVTIDTNAWENTALSIRRLSWKTNR